MWRLLLCIAFVACFGAAFWPNASGASDRGEVVNSPRHDEHVIYEIAEDNGAAGKLKIEGYKIGTAQSSGWARCCATTEARTTYSPAHQRRASPVTGPSKLRTVR